MAKKSVTAKIPKTGKEYEVLYDFGDDLDAMVEKFGDSVIAEKAEAQIKVNLQSFMRTLADSENPPDAKGMQKAVDEWVPGPKKRGKTKVEKVTESLQDFNEDELKALLATVEKRKKEQAAAG